MGNKKALSLILTGALMVSGGVYSFSHNVSKSVKLGLSEGISNYRQVENDFSRIENLSLQELYTSLGDKKFIEDYRNTLKEKIRYDSDPQTKDLVHKEKLYPLLGFFSMVTTMAGFFPIGFGISVIEENRKKKKTA